MQGVFRFRDLYRAYLACRRRKRGTRDAQRYELALLDHLVDTRERLNARRWSPATPRCFAVRRPKAREIHAAAFVDRVVHHWLVPRLEPLFEPIFIHDSFANRRGKGTHAAVARLQHFLRAAQQPASNSDATPAAATDGPHAAAKPRPSTLDTRHSLVHYLQLDVANCFNQIHKPTLFGLLQRRIGKAVRAGALGVPEAEALRDLCHIILRQSADRAQLVGKRADYARIPPHKRLAQAGPDHGLPIGNLTSQFFANVYLNELDQFVKHRLHCRYYVRYVDDIVLVHADPEQLRAWEAAIEAFLRERLHLALRPERRLAPITNGIDFLGYVVRPEYRLVRRRVVASLRAAVDEVLRRCVRPLRSGGQQIDLHRTTRERLRALLASYQGHLRHASAHRLWTSLWVRWPALGVWFEPPRSLEAPLRARWEPAGVTGYNAQLRFFRRRWPDAVLLVQRGNQFERLAPPSRASAAAEGRTPTGGSEAATPNAILPMRRLDAVMTQLRRRRRTHALITEAGHLKGGIKRRVLRRVVLFETQPGETPCALPAA